MNFETIHFVLLIINDKFKFVKLFFQKNYYIFLITKFVHILFNNLVNIHQKNYPLPYFFLPSVKMFPPLQSLATINGKSSI